jgi:hypothetical protein
MKKSKIGANEIINKCFGVPACALIRQPDGTVGFFIETCDDPRSARVRMHTSATQEAAAVREITASKEEQIKLVAKKLMTTMDAVEHKFQEETQALSRSGRRDTEKTLSKLRAQRDNDMVNLEAQAKATLAVIERDVDAQLAARREACLPEWVSNLTEESAAWRLLKPGARKKKTPKEQEALDDNDDDDPSKSVSSWPKFVEVVSLSRHRPPCSVENLFASEQLGTYSATYRQHARDGPVDLDKIILTPMVIHRNLGVHYQKRMVEGWNHEEVMQEINMYCGLPVVWRGCLPFTGMFEPKRLRRAWIVNWTLWFLLLAWLAWSFLSLRDTLPWPDIIATLLIGVILKPLSKMAQVMAIGLIVWYVLEGSGAYARFKAQRNDPDSILFKGQDPQDDTFKVTPDDDADEEDADAPRDKYVPPFPVATVAMASAKSLAAKAHPEEVYKAMQAGAALVKLDRSKQQEMTAIAGELVPKLEAEHARHAEKLAHLDSVLVSTKDDDAIELIEASRAESERTHQAALKDIEAQVRVPPLASPLSDLPALELYS